MPWRWYPTLLCVFYISIQIGLGFFWRWKCARNAYKELMFRCSASIRMHSPRWEGMCGIEVPCWGACPNSSTLTAFSHFTKQIKCYSHTSSHYNSSPQDVWVSWVSKKMIVWIFSCNPITFPSTTPHLQPTESLESSGFLFHKVTNHGQALCYIYLPLHHLIFPSIL